MEKTMLNKNFLLIVLTTLLVFSFMGCQSPTGSGSGDAGNPLMDGIWRSGNLDGYQQLIIKGDSWEYSSGSAGYIIARSKGYWDSSKPMAASARGILTLTVRQIRQGGVWENVPEETDNIKTNAAAFELNAEGNVLTLNAAILGEGIWDTLEGAYEKQFTWDGGTWSWSDGDSGSDTGIGSGSTILLSESYGTLDISGTLVDSPAGHWAGMGMGVENQATLTAMKTAQSISFNAKGRGTYRIALTTSDIRQHGEETDDWLWYAHAFTVNGTEQTIKLDIADFKQPDWGERLSFNQDLWDGIQFEVDGDDFGPYSLKVGNIKLSGIGTPVTEWHGLNVQEGAKGVQYDEYDGKTDVLFISPNPQYDWDVLTYDLSAYAEKKLKIDFSVEMKLTENGIAEWKIAKEGNDGWNAVNSNSRQILDAGTWYTVSGSYTMHDALQDPYNFRLEGYNDEWPMLQNASAYIANFSITVTEVIPFTSWHGLTIPNETTGVPYDEYDGKTDVLHISPTNTEYAWAALEYILNDYLGKRIRIELSMDVKLENPGRIAWQISGLDGGYPLVAGSIGATLAADTWHPISGDVTGTLPDEGWISLYLSSGASGQLKGIPVYIANFTLTVTAITGSDIVLELNNDNTGDPGTWEVHYRPDTLLNGYQITTGDMFTFTYSFKSDVAMDVMYIFLADNGNEANSYAWADLSNSVTVQQPVAAGTVYTGTVNITATGTAVDASTMANKLVIQGKAATRPTLTFTTLTLVKQ